MALILIIDDDKDIGDVLELSLKQEGYDILRAYSGTEARLVLGGVRPDLVLLDLMLPGLSGEELLPMLSGIPVIVVSARADLDSKVDLLNSGAADYITKPFELREVAARVAARLRGPGIEAPETVVWGCLTLDTSTRAVSANGREAHLTRTEFAILKLLMLNPRRVIPKNKLLDRISADTPDCTDSSLKIHISHLRRKLRSIGVEDPIEAVWGVGFKLRDIF